MKSILKIILPLFILKSFEQNSIEVPKAFKETNLPIVWSDEWYKLNNSKNEFQVSIADGKLEVSKYNACKICEFNTCCD